MLTPPSAPFRAPDVPLQTIEAIYNKLGPTPRLCFETEKSLIEYEASLNDALEGLSLAYLETLTTRNRLELDVVSHKIFMLRRLRIDLDAVEVDIQPISPFIAAKIASRMRALERHELVHLFNLYNVFSSTRRMAGEVFEAYCHLDFSTRIKFDFVPMVRIGGQPTTLLREKRMPQWFSSHTKFSGSALSQALEVLRPSALASVASLDVYPSRVVDYDSNEIAEGLHVEANVYYIPIKTNQEGIDSFILHDTTLYLLQMTVSDTHGISDELWPFLVSLKGLPPEPNWRFIFVKPPGKILACPVPRSAELRDLILYSAEVEVK
jgi:Retrotransposon hot spot protein